MGRDGRYTLTVRHGSEVERRQMDNLEQAIEEMRKQVEAIRAEGPLPKVSVPRDYEASDQVHARLEISTGRLLRRSEAGMDLMGDGSLVPFIGGVRRIPLEPLDTEDPFEAVHEALAAAT